MLFLSSDFALNYTSALTVKGHTNSGQVVYGSAYRHRMLMGGHRRCHCLSFAVMTLKGLKVADC